MTIRKVFVTGGEGFIGKTLVEFLQISNVSAISYDIKPSAAIVGDVLDHKQLYNEILHYDPDVIVHAAAQTSVLDSIQTPVKDAKVNIIGTINVLEVCRRLGVKIVLLSSGGTVYGECQQRAIEDDPRMPVSPYGISKAASEMYLDMYKWIYDVCGGCLRLSNVYGPSQTAGGANNLIANVMHAAETGRPIKLRGDGHDLRDFIYIDDVISAIVKAIHRAHTNFGTVNICTGESVSVLDVIKRAWRAYGIVDEDPPIAKLPSYDGEIHSSKMSPELAKSALNWFATTNLDEGLKNTAKWWKSV